MSKSVADYIKEFDEIHRKCSENYEKEIALASAIAIFHQVNNDRREQERKGRPEKEIKIVEPASEAQKKFARDLNIEFEESISKEDMRKLIQEAQNKKKSK